jgi:KRAB domain-containing zinc finger protein
MQEGCNQCNNSTVRKYSLKRHLKTHIGEKSNKCNQCDFASVEAGVSRGQLKTPSEKKCLNATNVTMNLFVQAISEHF